MALSQTTVNLDVSALQNEINRLKNIVSLRDGQLDLLKHQKKKAQDDTVEQLKKLEEAHKEEIQVLQKKIDSYEQQVLRLTKEIEAMQIKVSRIDQLEADVQILKQHPGKNERKANKLLMGSIAYHYLEGMVEYVHELKGRELYQLQRSVHSVEELEKLVSGDRRKSARLDEFKSKFFRDDYPIILSKLRKDRYEAAHPIYLNEETKEIPTPLQMTEIVSQIYKRETDREPTISLIDHLDQIRRSLGKEHLFGS